MQGYCMRFFSGRRSGMAASENRDSFGRLAYILVKFQSAPDAQRNSPAALQLGGRLHRGQRGGGGWPWRRWAPPPPWSISMCWPSPAFTLGPVHSVCPKIRRQGAGGHPPDSLHLSLGAGRDLSDSVRPGHLLCRGTSASAPHHPRGAPPGPRDYLGIVLAGVPFLAVYNVYSAAPPGDREQPGSFLCRSPSPRW